MCCCRLGQIPAAFAGCPELFNVYLSPSRSLSLHPGSDRGRVGDKKEGPPLSETPFTQFLQPSCKEVATSNGASILACKQLITRRLGATYVPLFRSPLFDVIWTASASHENSQLSGEQMAGAA